MAVGANVCKVFIKARTAEMLVRKMRKLQAVEGRYIDFHDKQFADGFWYAWYDKEMKHTMVKSIDNERN